MKEQVKIFRGLTGSCEDEINKWLAENADKVEIVRVLQSSATGGDSPDTDDILHMSIFYVKLNPK